tara:strand:- start:1457 stop:3187 length:1731 start_codon:yes stop_codon:yes gene_type:complete
MEDRKKHWFWGPVLRSKRLYFQVALGSVFINLFALVTAFYIMTVYDKVLPNFATDSLKALAFGVIIVFIFDYAMKMLRTYYIDVAGSSIDRSVGDKIFTKMTSQDIGENSHHEKRKAAGALSQIVREFDTLKNLFTSASLNTFIDLPFMLFFIGVIYSIAGPVAIVPLFIVISVFLFAFIVQPILKRFTNSSYDSNVGKYSVLVELLTNIDTVKAIAGGEKLKSKWNQSVNANSRFGLKARMVTAAASNFTSTGMQFSSLGIVFMGVYLVQDAQITTGALIASVILSGRTLAPLGQFSQTLGSLNNALKAYKQIDELMGVISLEESKTDQVKKDTIEGNISFKNVNFTYPGSNEAVFENLNLDINVGERIAIMGTVGSGKSTLISLILGLNKPTSGYVLLDKVDVNSIRQTDLRNNIGVVLQNVELFSGTLEDNIKINADDVTNDNFFAAARLSGVDEFAGKLQNAYKFNLQEGGIGLSGGQKQAIAWARGLINQPNLLILDEPTSAMDHETESKLLNNLEEYFSGRTVLFCTHRKSFIEKASRVIILDNKGIKNDVSSEEYLARLESFQNKQITG